MDSHEPSNRRRPTGYTPEQLQARALARTRRAAMRRRASRIRRSVAALALALFSAAFLGVYAQLASGHDPALSAAARRRTTATASLSAQKTSETAGTSSTASASTESSTSSGTAETSSTPSAVTTSQS